MPASFFPISVLQNSVKMTLEPPQGIRANLQRTYLTTDDKDLMDSKKPEVFKKLFFGFALFHAVIQDRRKFGPIGWNIAYEFTNEDLLVCKRQLRMLLDEYNEIPFKVLNYLGAEINYGGRVTDDKDVRLIKTILRGFICPEALRENFKFSESGLYISMSPGAQADYLNYIKELPLNPEPEIFGLHDNAEITNSQNQTRSLLETLLSSQPRSSAKAGKSREEVITEFADGIQKRTPQAWDIEEVSKKYPTMYEESMNTVLVQEVIRYNRLLEIMWSSLINVKKALKGEVVMSDELELLSNSLFNNQVPKMWEARGFLSLKPLASWIQDLNERVDFMNQWINKGTPVVFWISRI
jgi:dynein heavy chain